MWLFSCKAQQVFPLNASTQNIPSGSYIKDLNNDLDFYIGTWMSTYRGKTVKLIITKEIKRPYELLGKSLFEDIISIRYEVRDQNNNVLESTLNYNFGSSKKYVIESNGLNYTNDLNLIYGGTDCKIGRGFLIFKKNGSNQFLWSYKSRTIFVTDGSCPNYDNIHVYLPETENLIFTKQ